MGSEKIILINDKKYDYNVINSATKYPSIPTYHNLGEKGILIENEMVDIPPKCELYYSEKVDGANFRIVEFMNDNKIGNKHDMIIGTRDEFLYADGDRIASYDPRISSLLGILKRNKFKYYSGNQIRITYGELYGGKILDYKMYTNDPSIYGFSIFDVAFVNFDDVEGMTAEEASHWRDRGGQKYLTIPELKEFVKDMNINNEYLKIANFKKFEGKMCTKLEDVYTMMISFGTETNYALTENKKDKKLEGYVFRNNSRDLIFKIRFKEYEKTLGINSPKHKKDEKNNE